MCDDHHGISTAKAETMPASPVVAAGVESNEGPKNLAEMVTSLRGLIDGLIASEEHIGPKKVNKWQADSNAKIAEAIGIVDVPKTNKARLNMKDKLRAQLQLILGEDVKLPKYLEPTKN